MTTNTSTIEESMQKLSQGIRLFFGRRHQQLAHSTAFDMARTTTELVGAPDPVSKWDASARIDRGLGHARRVQRLIRIERSPLDTPGPELAEETAACLFVALMNLDTLTALSVEAHVFRLWYLASHAANPWGAAVRVFGKLRELPEHQQLAAGARTLDRIDHGLGATDDDPIWPDFSSSVPFRLRNPCGLREGPSPQRA